MRTPFGYFRVMKHYGYTRNQLMAGFYPISTQDTIAVDICCSFRFLHHKRKRILIYLPPMIADMAVPLLLAILIKC